MLRLDSTIATTQTCSVSFDFQLSQQIGFSHAHLHESDRGVFLTAKVSIYNPTNEFLSRREMSQFYLLQILCY
jgi:hypothetical protein